MFARRRSCGRTATIIAALGLALTATACGGGSGGGGDGPVELRFSWWGNTDRAAITEEAIALFEQRNPGVDVVTSFQDYEPYWQRIATETAGGGAPDVFQMDYSYLSEYADRGVLLDLEEYAGAVLAVDDFVPGLEQAGVVDGTRVAVPWSGNTFATMYVPAEYEEAGVEPPREGDTWEEFDSKVAQFDGAATGMYGAADYTGVFYVFEIQLRQNGGVMFTEDGTLGFEPADLEEFWRHSQELRDAGAVVPVEKAVEVAPVSALGSGIVATEMSWDNFLVRYEGEQEQDVAGSIEAAFIRIHEEMSYGRISVEDAVEQFFGEADRLLAS
ncbi:ABC transporter substrate-binding protein [Pseudonocardia nigra]|uniref:ABC transporter substrate-binding protein n=1 Tax=Pseudonocardia nigra TaxID=1921578 RepID=UPI001C5DE1C3|nr:extracellular solute-binding protein [Pseudonocardia nigra]